MPGSVLASFRRLIALIESAVRDRTFDVFGATAIMLAALAWQLGKILIADPEILVYVPMLAGVFVSFGAMVFGVSAVAWLVVRLTVSFVRWRVREEIKPGQAWPAIASAIAVVIFLGVPELCEAVAWWQKHFFSLLPNEKPALKAIQEHFIRFFRD